MIEETLNNLKLINQLEILIPITILSVILVAISKSGFGGALGSLGLPVMVLAFPPKLAIAILLPLYLITDIFVAYTWRKFPVLKILKLSKKLNLEASYGNFVRGNDNGLGETFNLGLRYLLTK